VYEELYNAWKREKLEKDLQGLSKNFYEELSQYVRRLKESQRALDEKTVKAKLLSDELERVKKLSSQLVEMRFRKIIDMTLKNAAIPLSFFTREEERIFENLSKIVKLHNEIKSRILEGKDVETLLSPRKEEAKKILVRFTCDVPAIIGIDMKQYGPFKSEDVAALPRQNAEALLRQGAAVKMEVEENEGAEGNKNVLPQM
jgi:DNA replication factor GINS